MRLSELSGTIRADKHRSDDPSTLSAINAQLLSHGWTKRPLDLSALDEKNHTEVVTVLFELLGSSLVRETKWTRTLEADV